MFMCFVTAALCASHTIQVNAVTFNPNSVLVSEGDLVVFEGVDGRHTITSYDCGGTTTYNGGPLNVNVFDTGDTYSFNTSGHGVAPLCYFCAVHGGMTGVINFSTATTTGTGSTTGTNTGTVTSTVTSTGSTTGNANTAAPLFNAFKSVF